MSTPSGHDVVVDDDVVPPGSLSIGSHGYAQFWDREKKTIVLLHRWLLGLEGGGHTRIADHINRDKLDNRRENLRVVTPSESNMNRVLRDRGLPTGVYLTRDKRRYRAVVFEQGKARQIGEFSTPEEAAEARASVLV